MHKNSILYTLRANDIAEEHIEVFAEKLKDKKFTIEDCDKLLEKLGYEKLFLIDVDMQDDEDYDDEDYDDYERSGSKQHFDD